MKVTKRFMRTNIYSVTMFDSTWKNVDGAGSNGLGPLGPGFGKPDADAKKRAGVSGC